MRKYLFLFLILANHNLYSQENRISLLRNQIESIISDSPGLNEKVNINIKEATLPAFLLAVSEVHKINISVSPNLNQINLVNNFTDVSVADLIIFLCKEYNLTIDFTGNILSIKSFEKPIEKPIEKVINAEFNSPENLLSVDLKEDKLYDVFKKIMDITGKNIVFSPSLKDKLLTSYIKNMPLEAALNKIAYTNNLNITKTKDNFFLVDDFDSISTYDPTIDKNSQPSQSNRPTKPMRSRKSNFYFNVIDPEKKTLDVDFENTPISSIVNDIGDELGINIYIATPLENTGNATFRAKNISFDNLLTKLFENKNNSTQSQNNSTIEEGYSFKKNGNIYYFGLKNQLSVRTVKTITLNHRSIQLMGDPSSTGRSSGRIKSQSNQFSSISNSTKSSDFNNPNFSNTDNSSNTSNYSSSVSSILSIIPDELKKDLDIKIDNELNSLIVNGPELNLSKLESFIKYIDKPVPVILIEVMLLENSRSSVVETGINAGIGEKPATTKGGVFPNSDITFGAETLNKIINNFNGFGSLNIGNVIPNFYLSLKALETNGNLKIKSTPRLSTLNAHKAYLSIGETTYYVVTNQNFYGSQIPQTSEIKNYQPIDAELSLSIMPLVSGDGQITMDIKVVQSNFNGQKVDKNAPPGINSREFTSIIRVKDQDLVVLGGLEEKVKNDSGTGVPLLSRIPILKWFFSSRKREDSNKKLTVLIKPTVIY